MRFCTLFVCALSVCVFAAEQTQPTPYDLIRPIWPVAWDTSGSETATAVGFSKLNIANSKTKTPLPKTSVPTNFKPNAYQPDTLDQAYRDAMNLRIGRIRVNQAGYLQADEEKQFYYVSANPSKTTTYQVVDLNGKVLGEGKLQATSTTTESSWIINAGVNATRSNYIRYQADEAGPTGTIMRGYIAQVGGLPIEQRLRIKVGNELSASFIISDRVYSMARDASLKFFGLARSGKSESWFHKDSHISDGQEGTIVNDIEGTPSGLTKHGDLSGGWYDCGDHLKESQTQAYNFLVLSILHASNPERDEDNYAYNHGETSNTDGIPDVLREAKHGADFFLKAYDLADGVIDNMAVSIGNFGADHGWWGRPETQDKIPASTVGRGGPHERDIRLGELGSNVSAAVATGLAILGKDYAIYDATYAAKCLKVAKELYVFAKDLQTGAATYANNKTPADWNTPAYQGNNEAYDELGAASIALLYATKDTSYLTDAVKTKFSIAGGDAMTTPGSFTGGWFTYIHHDMYYANKVTGWPNVHTFAAYGFHNMILKTEAMAKSYGISNEDRLKYDEMVGYMLGSKVVKATGSGSGKITLPGAAAYDNVTMSYDDIWYNTPVTSNWIYNRYVAGNLFDAMAYANVTENFDYISFPLNKIQSWHSADVKRLAINMLNYMLGVNPWDVSFLYGVGDKNDAHPHHRAANPEGKNVPGAAYKYVPPVGGLFGGVPPDGANVLGKLGALSWEDYFTSEACSDAAAIFIACDMNAAKEEDLGAKPKDIKVEIQYAGFDSAIVVVKTDVRSLVMIQYSTSETGPFNQVVTSDKASVNHKLIMKPLQGGTTYYFKVTAINSFSERYSMGYLVDSTRTPYFFTTLNSNALDADIQNVRICNVSADSAEIMWYTPNGQYESKVYWDTVLTTYDKMRWNTGDGNADVSGIPTQFHYVKIGGLQEQKTYYVVVESNGTRQMLFANNEQISFTTPVMQYDFEVRSYQYAWSDMEAIDLNIYNNEDRAFDSLTLRLYWYATEAQMSNCAFMIREDICQAYDEAGFNKPCENDSELRALFRDALPVKLDDTYDAATGKYAWYFPVPLGSTTIKSSSRLRLDLLFTRGIANNGICAELSSGTDKKPSIADGDWTWVPHSMANGDPADYSGMPIEDKDFGDADFADVNPYVVVYRKNEFVWGYSPSYQEMTTKRANYKMQVAFDAPFNVSSGTYIKIDSTISTMHVTGTASITEGGYITGIWVNGTALSEATLASAAIRDNATGDYKLDIPVKLGIGTNKVDVTIFAGPDPQCEACTKNGGCAFVNRNYFIQFSKGDRTAGVLSLVKQDGTPVTSPAETDGSLKFYIVVKDKDNRGNKSIQALLLNSRTGDTLRVTLNRVDENTGEFKSDLLTAIAEKNAGLPKISFFGGDKITVTYIDAEDEEDVASQYFFADPTHPVPQDVLVKDSNCDALPDQVTAVFSGSTFGNGITLDSALFEFDSTSTSKAMSVLLKPEKVEAATASFKLLESQRPATGAPSGTVTFYMTEKGVVTSETAPLKDAIAPALKGVTILENEGHQIPEDTLKIIFTEPVVLPSTTQWPLRITDGANEVPQTGISVISASSSDNGRSWLYVISGNNGGALVKQGLKAEIIAGFVVSDKSMNSLTTCRGPVTITESVRPVPITFAKMYDKTGDGQPDEVYMEFETVLRQKDLLDSFDVYWASPEIYQAFKDRKAWSLDTAQGEMVIKPILTKTDSTMDVKSTIYKEVIGQDTTWCKQTKEVEDTTTHTMVTEYVIDANGDTVTYACAYKDKTKNVTRLDTLWNYTIDTTGHDTSQKAFTVLRVNIPDGVYKNKTHGDHNGRGLVMPRKGEEGGFFDKSYSLNDACPPVLTAARLSKYGETYALRVELSEPLVASENDKAHFLERSHDGRKSYYNPPDPKMDRYTDVMLWTFSFREDAADDNVRIGDSLRLPVMLNSITKDKANLLPGDESPWVTVVGEIEEVRFKVKMAKSVSTTAKGDDLYAGNLPTMDEDFRLSVLSGASETLIARGKDKLVPYGTLNSYDTAAYKHGGPVFNVDVEMPLLLQTDSLNNFAWKAHVSFSMDVYTNMGAHVTQTEYGFDLDQIGVDKLSADGTIHLKLEWLPHNGNPTAENGKAIGTGPYIAKFIFHSREVAIAPTANKKYRAGTVKKQSKEKRVSLGYRRTK